MAETRFDGSAILCPPERASHPAHQGNGNAQVKLAASLPFSTTRRCLCHAWQHRLGTKAKPSVLPAALLSQSLKNKVQFVLAVTGSASFSCLVTPCETSRATGGHCGPHRPAARYFFRNRSGSVAKFAAIRRASSLVSILAADRLFLVVEIAKLLTAVVFRDEGGAHLLMTRAAESGVLPLTNLVQKT
jgi:hypothetical protein